ncbi:MAG: hypothetical protein DHS20C14_02440 [Phycisphaeraceae bacterium]|nr:MAG: hypothetical protein DHS20C14_02440 [Phycisphaeraceae bacterium]
MSPLARLLAAFTHSGTARAPASPTGRRGERLAAGYLKRKGYRVLARNLDTGVGEADLVCESPDGRTLVVVEVKARVASADPGERRPEASITSRKQHALRRIAHALARRDGFRDRPIRIDVVAVDLDARGRKAVAIRHHENAVGG